MPMRYHALASDYDGTLAHDGRVNESTIHALERCRNSGRKLILVTGRELDDLFQVFLNPELFDRIVAENGALVYNPSTRETTTLGERPPERFVSILRERGVAPVSVGQVIIATWRPHENSVLETIRDLGLELQVIFNKGAVMILPSGINKAAGLEVALKELGISPHNAVAVGDAENDHALFNLCECSVAVQNALPALKETADNVTMADHGAGVEELIEQLLGDDLRSWEDRLERHGILLGSGEDGDVKLKPYGMAVMLAGSSGSGKSTLTAGFLERLAEKGYQYCIIDPEGDYRNLERAVVLGDSQRVPGIDEALDVLKDPSGNAVLNLLGIPLADRPAFFEKLLPRLMELRTSAGHPHWIVIDEAHHLLPGSWNRDASGFVRDLGGVMLITVHPEHVPENLLSAIDTILVTGKAPDGPLTAFGRAAGVQPHQAVGADLESGEYVCWNRAAGPNPVRFRATPPSGERRRHFRKYAEGQLEPDRSFFFRGPEGKLNLRAQNLVIFLQIAEGVDDETWAHHLKQGDYSQWLREKIKDEELGEEVAAIERVGDLAASESRRQIREAIEGKYTAPA